LNLIVHRCNTTAKLLATPSKYGVEVDVRSWGERLIVHHDPFVEGESLETWIKAYHHGTLILNVKEEGLESRLIELMLVHGIVDFFFLDQSFPFIVKWAQQGERRCAVRVSEFESVQTAMSLAGKVDWAWVDCFTKVPLSTDDAKRLTEAGFKLCLVSPELQGRDADTGIPQTGQQLMELDIFPEAICTKRPELWAAQIEG